MAKRGNRVSIDGMAAAIAEELDAYSFAGSNAVREIIDSLAEETAGNINAGAPRRTGKYAGSWRSGYEKAKGSKYSKTVYADSDGYRIAHLLEHGHATRKGGRTPPVKGKLDRVAARVHIQGPADKVEERFIERLRQYFGGNS